ncbi:hypothetical protein [Wolbachia endosymbiont (group B) of Erebia ligea]|uniref:hypothetical protein n=1 Tax=Wolbachia endosymbiont (group B) of Erebia ligea TaxID=2954010 RepID=UPI0021F81DAC|nr:hypothetical protein [Wolbachia endosymbiont (group B) of Erebia ligea]
MWKSIKKFFKWIADHTGISWIARKISSGWKWLFGGKSSNAKQNLLSEQEKFSSNTLTKTLDNTVNHEKPVADYQIHDSRADITQSKERDNIAGIYERKPGMLEL